MFRILKSGPIIVLLIAIACVGCTKKDEPEGSQEAKGVDAGYDLSGKSPGDLISATEITPKGDPAFPKGARVAGPLRFDRAR